jgi:hypothetical protein
MAVSKMPSAPAMFLTGIEGRHQSGGLAFRQGKNAATQKSDREDSTAKI